MVIEVNEHNHAHHHAHGPANRGRRVVRTTAPLFVRFPVEPARAAVIVLHDVYGLSESIEHLCRSFAARGYVAVAPYLYYDTGGQEFRPEHACTARAAMSLLDPDDLDSDISGSLDYLTRRVGLPVGATGLLGLGMGGYLASKAAADHELAAVAALDPLGVDTAPWPGMATLDELVGKLNSPWFGVAGERLPPDRAHALVRTGPHTRGRNQIRIDTNHKQTADRTLLTSSFDNVVEFFATCIE